MAVLCLDPGASCDINKKGTKLLTLRFVQVAMCVWAAMCVWVAVCVRAAACVRVAACLRVAACVWVAVCVWVAECVWVAVCVLVAERVRVTECAICLRSQSSVTPAGLPLTGDSTCQHVHADGQVSPFQVLCAELPSWSSPICGLPH